MRTRRTALTGWGAPILALILAGCDGGGSMDSAGSEDPDDTGGSNDSSSDEDTSTEDPSQEFVELKSDIEREADPQPDAADLTAVVEGNWELNAELLRRIASTNENAVISPTSFRYAFSLLYAGARGTTEADLSRVIGFAATQDGTHTAMNFIDQALDSRQYPEDEEHGALSFGIANRVFLASHLTPEPVYLDRLAKHYGAGVFSEDFMTDPEASRQRMNAWVKANTNDKISELLPMGSVLPNTNYYIINALQFKAPWAFPFLEEKTQDKDFHRLDGSTVSAATMQGNAIRAPYFEHDNAFIVDLPFYGNEMSMSFILPKEGAFETLLNGLDTSFLNEVDAGFEEHDIELTLPKFKIRYGTTDFLNTFKAMGLADALTTGDYQDFLPSSPEITTIKHQAFIDVNEKGVDAAAATAIGSDESAVPLAKVDIDRPFLFMIRDRPTGIVLFSGWVVDPTL